MPGPLRMLADETITFTCAEGVGVADLVVGDGVGFVSS